jgi:predicted DNA-binding transcriptional regulator AlpA
MMNNTALPVDAILGTAEVASVLGVSKQRIHSLRQMPEFPEPVKILASTPIWDKAEIMSFLAVWRPWKVLGDDQTDL